LALLNPRIKHWLHLIGSGLGIAGIIFVIFQLKTYANQLDLSTIKGHSWALILVLSAIYGGSNLLLASAWWHLMKQFKVEANIYWSIRVYGITQ
jgi:predicted membrane channel-forming protein YqfA (hemolysin III family)